MRASGLILILLFCGTALADTLTFETKGYRYRANISNESIEIEWDKSGFKRAQSKKMNLCWKKIINKEIINLRKQLFTQRGKHKYGPSVEISWNKEKQTRHLFPRQLDKLDKRFTHLFNTVKLSESKCIK